MCAIHDEAVTLRGRTRASSGSPIKLAPGEPFRYVIEAMTAFQNFVKENEKWFRGRFPETDATLDYAESQLGLRIPDEIRWLLKTYGYWHGTGISDIQESIDATIQAREHLKLPNNFVILYDHQDGGVVLLDTDMDETTGNYHVIDTSWESVPNDMRNEIVYASVLDYLKRVIEVMKTIIDHDYIECKD